MNKQENFGLDVPISGAYADPRRLVDLAVAAEDAGWDGFFLQDIVYGPGPLVDPTVTLAAIAQRTHSIGLGIFMIALPRRRPWKVAREMLTLDHLSGGRVTLGVGLGFQPEEFVPFGESYDLRGRAEKLDEGLAIIAAEWQGEPFNFHGKHYSVDLPACLPRPVQQPRIPIWTSGGWPRRKPLDRAARWDGIYLMTVNQVTGEPITPAEVAEARDDLLARRQVDAPFDIAVNFDFTGDPHRNAQLARPFFAAGATCCTALAPDDPAEYLAWIKAGAPGSTPEM